MERYMAIVELGKVTKKLVVNPLDQSTIDHFGGVLLPADSPVDIGWDSDGVSFSYTPPPKTAEEIAKEARDANDREAIEQSKADATVRYLVTHTPQECYDKVMADVGSLAQAKEMMGRMAMALSAIARKQLR